MRASLTSSTRKLVSGRLVKGVGKLLLRWETEEREAMSSDSQRESVAAVLDRHADEEAKILKQYRDLAEQLADGPMGVLIDHIMTEEELHHFLLLSLAKWLRQPPAEDAGPQGELREALLQRTRQLQEHELETIDACRALKSQLPGEEGELLRTLMDAMALDSEKHHKLLAAVAKMMGA